MKIGIHNQPAGGSIGGSEVCVGVLASALSHDHSVEVIHHRPDLNREDLAQHCGVDLNTVGMRFVEPKRHGGNPITRLSQNYAWHRDLSKPYDLFVTFTHFPPQFCHAPKGVLVSLFPYEARGQGSDGHPLTGLRRGYDEWRWSRRFQGYQTRTAISEFSRVWTERRWKLDCRIFYPPVDVTSEAAEKESIVLSVGRFSASGVSKHQKDMVCTFRQIHQAAGPSGWKYACAGGLSDVPLDQQYYQAVREAAAGCPVDLLPNIDRSSLKALYEKAAIFWHAAGLGAEAEESPNLMEHFGITTVEAMAAGCVPVVVNKGAQPEIVQHGINGFLWETPEELRHYTQLLMRDEVLRLQMSQAARERAQDFSREQFVERFYSLLGEAQ